MLHIAPIAFEVWDDTKPGKVVVTTPTDESGINCTCSDFTGECCEHVHAVQELHHPDLLNVAQLLLHRLHEQEN